MNRYYQFVMVLVLTGIASHASAEAPGYSFLTVGYSQFSSKIDGISEAPEGNGVSLDLSVAVRPYVAVTAGYKRGSASVTTSGSTVDSDTESTAFGVLVHLPINKIADLILAVSFINGSTSVNKNGAFYANIGSDGGVTTLGVRAMVFDTLELNGFMYKTSIQDTSRIGISLGAAWYFVDTVSADVDFFIDSDNDFMTVGVSKYF